MQTVAAGAEQMGASIREIASNAAEASEVAAKAVVAAETTTATVAKLGRLVGGDRQRRQGHHEHRRADEPAGAERHDRGGAGRGGRQGLRRRGQRGQGAGPGDGEGDRGHRPPGAGHPGRHHRRRGRDRGDLAHRRPDLRPADDHRLAPSRSRPPPPTRCPARCRKPPTAPARSPRNITGVSTAADSTTQALGQTRTAVDELSRMASRPAHHRREVHLLSRPTHRRRPMPAEGAHGHSGHALLLRSTPSHSHPLSTRRSRECGRPTFLATRVHPTGFVALHRSKCPMIVLSHPSGRKSPPLMHARTRTRVPDRSHLQESEDVRPRPLPRLRWLARQPARRRPHRRRRRPARCRRRRHQRPGRRAHRRDAHRPGGDLHGEPAAAERPVGGPARDRRAPGPRPRVRRLRRGASRRAARRDGREAGRRRRGARRVRAVRHQRGGDGQVPRRAGGLPRQQRRRALPGRGPRRPGDVLPALPRGVQPLS